jgi:hypothetical protein
MTRLVLVTLELFETVIVMRRQTIRASLHVIAHDFKMRRYTLIPITSLGGHHLTDPLTCSNIINLVN